jgi:hypothetical protein
VAPIDTSSPSDAFGDTGMPDITKLFSDTALNDEELLDFSGFCEALGPPGRPASRRTGSRLLNGPNGLAHFEVAGRIYVRVGTIREHVRTREIRKNPLREDSSRKGRVKPGC